MQSLRGLPSALLFLALGLGSQLSFAGQPRLLTVIVVTGDGYLVTDLLEKDFTVFEQNSIRPITSFRAFRGECELWPAISYVDFSRKGANRVLDCLPRYELSFDNATTMPHESPQIKINRPGLKIFLSRRH